MADRVARSLVLLCNTDMKLCYRRRLEYDFLAFFLPSSFFSSFSPSLYRYVSLLRITSSVQQSSAPRQQVRVLASFVLCLTSRFLSFFVLFFVVLIGWRVCCVLVPGTLAFALPTVP